MRPQVTDVGTAESPPRLARAVPRVAVGLAALLVTLRVAAGLHEGTHPVPYPTLVEWRGIQNGEAEAARDGRLVLYDFTASWCEPCKRQDREVFAHRKRARVFSAQGVPVRVAEGDRSKEAEALRARFAVQSYPLLVAAAPGGSFVQRHGGYGGPSGTLVFVQDAAATWSARRRAALPRSVPPVAPE